MKKNEVFVKIDTPKKAEKVFKVLTMFNEDIYTSLAKRLENNEVDEIYKCINFNDEWIGNRGLFKEDKTEVSIKELKQILAVEHLKEGDVVKVCNGYGSWLVKLTGNNIEKFEHSESYDLDLEFKQEFIDESSNLIRGGRFIRYATDEEKALLEPKKDKKELEVGKWYKGIGDKLICLTSKENKGHVKAYGFGALGGWYEDDNDYSWTADELVEATKEEVEQALIKEANKRYKVGDKVKSLANNYYEFNISEYKFMQFGKINDLWVKCNGCNALIYRNGKWADIVEEPKRIRVIYGGYGAEGCNGMTGIIVDEPIKKWNGAFSPVLYVKMDNCETWGLAKDHKIEEIKSGEIELTIDAKYVAGQDLPTFTTKDLATIIAMKQKLQELEDKFSKLV